MSGALAEKITGRGIHNVVVWDATLEVMDYQEIADLSAAASLPSIPDGATAAVIAVDGANARMNPAGGVPTSASGIPLVANQWYFVNFPLDAIKLIEQAASAKAYIVYLGRGL